MFSICLSVNHGWGSTPVSGLGSLSGGTPAFGPKSFPRGGGSTPTKGWGTLLPTHLKSGVGFGLMKKTDLGDSVRLRQGGHILTEMKFPVFPVL